MQLRVYRSLWGIDPDRGWKELFPSLKAQGYDGIECSLGDIAGREEFFVGLIKVTPRPPHL